MKIAIDAMGGDHAPEAVVAGVVTAAREKPEGRDLILVGDKERIEEELARLAGGDLSNISIVHASQIVDMDESPVIAIRRKKDSSIMKATSLVKEKKADAVVTAGNTGAAVIATRIKWRFLAGVKRPAIAMVLPSPNGLFIILDVGATPECEPSYLFQFALMGGIYAKYILNVSRPRVGVLSLGTEESKGTELTKGTVKLLQAYKGNFDFVGNVEGNDLFSNKTDVIICDGYVGNVVLKVCERLGSVLQYLAKEEIMKSFWAKLGGLLMKPSLKRMAAKLHYAEYGGAPLLGVNGTCIICHGRSSAQAIKQAINVAEYMIIKDVNKHIVEVISGNE